jgi:hypothetical protein
MSPTRSSCGELHTEFNGNGRPTLICHGRSTNVGDGERKTPRKGEDWRRAEIDVDDSHHRAWWNGASLKGSEQHMTDDEIDAL